MFENYNQEESHFTSEEANDIAVTTKSKSRSDALPSVVKKDIPQRTLEESVAQTIKRDLSRIASKLLLIILPTNFAKVQKETIQDWDLWGPFVFYLTSAAFVHKVVRIEKRS